MHTCTLQMTPICVKQKFKSCASCRPPAVKVKNDSTTWPAGNLHQSPDSNAS